MELSTQQLKLCHLALKHQSSQSLSGLWLFCVLKQGLELSPLWVHTAQEEMASAHPSLSCQRNLTLLTFLWNDISRGRALICIKNIALGSHNHWGIFSIQISSQCWMLKEVLQNKDLPEEHHWLHQGYQDDGAAWLEQPQLTTSLAHSAVYLKLYWFSKTCHML